jgi:hypothetical protein
MTDAFDYTQTAEQEAQASAGKLNFGKLKISPRFLMWQDRKPIEIDAGTYAKLGARERSLEYVFGVDIQEFKPELQFTYERKVQVGGLDWNKTFKPSLETIFGKDTVAKDLAACLRQLHGAYVCIDDVPQIATKAHPDRAQYSTVKLVARYATREACYAAWKEKYGGSNGGGNGKVLVTDENLDVPIGYTAETWEAMKPDLYRLYIKHASVHSPAEAARFAGEEYGASAAQVASLLEVNIAEAAPAAQPESDGIPF